MYEHDECPQCGDDRVEVLGYLGSLAHYRCQACGWMFHRTESANDRSGDRRELSFEE